MRFFTLFTLFFIATYTLKSQNPIHINSDDTLLFIGKHCLLKQNAQKDVTIEKIMQETDFESLPNEHVLMGNGRPKNIWLKFKIDKKNLAPTFLELTFPLIDTARLYMVENGVITSVQECGQNTFIDMRPLHLNNMVFELKNSNQPITYYVNAQVRWTCNIKPRIGTYKALIKEYHHDDILQGLFVGVIMVFVLYNFFVFLRLKDRVYLLYSLYLFFGSCFIFRHHGFLIEFLFAHKPYLNDFTMISPNLAGVFGMMFTARFLNTQTELPRIHKFISALLLLYCINTLIAFFGYLELSIIAVQLIMPLGTFAVVCAAIIVWRRGNPTAKYYLLGWMCLSLGLILFLLENSGILPYNNYTAYALHVGIGMEAIVLSYAIAHRFGLIKEEQDCYHNSLLDSAMHQQKQINEQNRILEQMVAERTNELQNALGHVNMKEEELKEYAYRLEISNKELTEFAHIASHDLKAPLRSIMSFAQLFERRNKDKFDDTDREYFNYIKSNAGQSARLIEDLLNYSKIDKNLGEPTKVDVNKCIFVAEMNMQSLIREKNAVIHYDNLPILRGHTSLITQLFQNFINNGIKYNKSEQPTIHIDVQRNDRNEYVFSVSDNGIGIAPENQDKVFAMFQRLHTQSEYDGTGIGLSFCTRIIETYGGKIWIESDLDKGTTFYFTLPKAVVVEKKREEKTELEIA